MTPKKSNLIPLSFNDYSKWIQPIWIGCLLGVALGWMMPHWTPDYQSDYRVYYYPQAHQVRPDRILNPLWLYFVITPLSLLPFQLSFLAFGLFNTALIALSTNLLKLSWPQRFLLLFSFPVHWLYRLGQLDGFVMLGVALGWWTVVHKYRFLLGLAIALLLAKPHIGGPIALLYLWWLRDWRALMIPLLLLFLSQMIWGFEWPLIWLSNILTIRDTNFVDQETNITLFPFGLLAWLILLVPMERFERLVSVICATFLSLPYAPVYSLLILLVLPVPLWLHIPVNISYIRAYTFEWIGINGFYFGVLTPLLGLGWAVFSSWKKKRIADKPVDTAFVELDH